MNGKELIKPFKETIYKDGIEDVTIDFAEIALDELTKLIFKGVSDEVLDWPLIKDVSSIGKIAWSIGKAVSLRKQLAFIQQLRKGVIDPRAIEKRKVAIDRHERWIEKEIETSVIYLERYANVKKAVYQARMYRDLLNGKIDFDEYEEYLTIIDQLFIGDASYLLDIICFFTNNKKDFFNTEKIDELSKHFDKIRCARLQSLGLLSGIITTRTGFSIIDGYIPTDRADYLYSVIRDDNDTVHPKIIIGDQSNIES